MECKFRGGGEGAGGLAPEIGGREAGEERAGSGREIRNANYFNITIR